MKPLDVHTASNRLGSDPLLFIRMSLYRHPNKYPCLVTLLLQVISVAGGHGGIGEAGRTGFDMAGIASH